MHFWYAFLLFLFIYWDKYTCNIYSVFNCFIRYLFIADWSESRPSISRSYLDGSHYKVLFDSSVVTWPNGVTIDFSDNRIFWTDANQDYIASSGFDGESMKYIIRGKRLVPHPFAVVVYKVCFFFLFKPKFQKDIFVKKILLAT